MSAPQEEVGGGTADGGTFQDMRAQDNAKMHVGHNYNYQTYDCKYRIGSYDLSGSPWLRDV